MPAGLLRVLSYQPLFHKEVLLVRNETKQWTDKRYGGLDRRWLFCILGEMKERREKYISRNQTSKAQRERRRHCAVPEILARYPSGPKARAKD